jgi:hypothetical protein
MGRRVRSMAASIAPLPTPANWDPGPRILERTKGDDVLRLQAPIGITFDSRYCIT